jgi:hypothetical protein
MKTISNTEKAREIAENAKLPLSLNETDEVLRAVNTCSKKGYFKTAVKYGAFVMAQHKDEQIDTIMLTIEGCLRSFFESQGNTQESIDNFIDALKTQINENLNKL